MAGKDENGNQILEPYMSAGYELFTYNNGVKNKITNITDNFTFFTGNHKLTAGLAMSTSLPTTPICVTVRDITAITVWKIS